MSTVDPLSPWAEDKDEAALGHLFASVPEPGPLSELSRQRVGARLRSRASRGAGLMLVRLIAVGLVIGVAAAAAAQWAGAHFFAAQSVMAPPVRASVKQPAPASPPSRRQQAAVPAAPPQPVDPEPAPAPPPVSAASAAAVAPSALGLEAASLQAALSVLRGGGAQGAARGLTELDQHLRAYPHGALELEARVARIDALLTLGRRQDAKRELSSLPLESAGRNRELRLIRAELRADDDCRAALADFQVLVDQSLPPAWAERALFGRGACLLKLGDRVGAERDFERYLERFPQGRFAAQIRAQQP